MKGLAERLNRQRREEGAKKERRGRGRKTRRETRKGRGRRGKGEKVRRKSWQSGREDGKLVRGSIILTS